MNDHFALPDPQTTRVEHAAHAIDAYERAALPNDRQALPGGDSAYSQAVLGALIGDLEHWAAAYGVDFDEVLEAARSTHADEIAEQTTYEIGDQVRLRLQPDRCGVVTDVMTGPDTEAIYQVHVPGMPYFHAEPAVHLEVAPPFPPVATRLGVVHRADHAEATLIELTAHARRNGPKGDIVGKEQSEELLAALSAWSGTPSYDLIKDLAPKVARRIVDFLNEMAETAKAVPPLGAARLAADDFPYDIGNGIATPSQNQGNSLRSTRPRLPGRSPG